ncbi:MAG: Hpt domain-containing protein [Coleofasciculus sp. G3-WIS-01]|uniref:Hpt domain-containing protein n=1 Tax=Coleofasciculus sp. G3-WIS-01 TaxID=3069528 RepID=UPI0032F30A9B
MSESDFSPINPTNSIEIDFDRLEEVSLGEVELKRELLVALLQVIHVNLEAIQQAEAANDYLTVARCAHQIKGAAANVGVSSLRAIATELERQAKAEKFSSATDLLVALESQELGVQSYISNQLPE